MGSPVVWLRSHRSAVNFAAALACFGLYGYARFYAEDVLGFQPCPLCIFQRAGVISLGVAFVVAGLLSLRQARWASITSVVLVVLAAALASGVAGRHVYVQAQPAGTYQSCGASLEWMMEINPLFEVVRKVLTAPGDCANVDWSFLGLAMPAWVLLWSLGLGLLGVITNWPAPRRTAVAP